MITPVGEAIFLIAIILGISYVVVLIDGSPNGKQTNTNRHSSNSTQYRSGVTDDEFNRLNQMNQQTERFNQQSQQANQYSQQEQSRQQTEQFNQQSEEARKMNTGIDYGGYNSDPNLNLYTGHDSYQPDQSSSYNDYSGANSFNDFNDFNDFGSGMF